MADGSFLPAKGGADRLTLTGARTPVRLFNYTPPITGNSTTRQWHYNQIGMTWTGAHGDTKQFTYWEGALTGANQDAQNNPGPPSTYWDTAKSLPLKNSGNRLADWHFPYGVDLTFAYGAESGVGNAGAGIPVSVTSSLGRTLNLPAIPTSSCGPSALSLSVADLAGDTTTVGFLGTQSGSGTTRPVGSCQVSTVYEPINTSQPAIQYTYDTLGRVMTAADAVSIQQGTRGPYQYFIAPGYRGEWQDPLGGRYAVETMQANRFSRTIDELGRLTATTLDGRGRVLSRTFPANDGEQFAYDANDNVVMLTQTPKVAGSLSNIVISATYDPVWNKLASITDANGNATTLTYNTSGAGASLLQKAQRPAVNAGTPIYTYQYNSAGLPTLEADATGVTTTHGYDSLGDLTSTTTGAAAANGQSALNLTNNFTPDSVGNVIATTDARGNADTTQYDVMRRKLNEQHRNGGVSALPLTAEQYTYDADGRKLTDQKATGFDGSGNATGWEVTTTAYTPTSKIASVTDPLNEVTATAYDALDRIYQVTDPVGRISQITYDVASEKIADVKAVGTPLQQTYATYSYNLDGLQVGVKDANGNYTTQGRDGFNRPQTTYFPSTTKGSGTSDGTNYETLGYDANGNETSFRKRDGNTITYQYDALNRETQKSVPAVGSAAGYGVYSSYDLTGRTISARFGSTSGPGVVYTYDAAGRRLTESTNGQTLTSAYDAASNRTGLTWPDGNVATYAYDPLDRMSSAAMGGVSTNFGYDPLSRRTALNRSTGAATSYGYDAADRMTALSHDLAGTAADVSFGFGYTAASQISSRSISNASYLWSNPTAATQSFTADGLNRDATLAATSGGYDLNGNLTFDGTRTFSYDGENHLVTVSAGGATTLALAYDPNGRLQQTTASGAATNFLYDGDNLVAELNSSNAALRRYVPGSDEDEPLVWFEGSGLSAPRPLHADRQGSIIGWSDSAANSGGTFTYGPYGERSSWSGPRYAYTGQIALPEAQLYYYKARIYDPVRGWFLQTDPVGYQDDLNLYAYTGGDPVNEVDSGGTERINLPTHLEGVFDRSRVYGAMAQSLSDPQARQPSMFFYAAHSVTSPLGGLSMSALGAEFGVFSRSAGMLDTLGEQLYSRVNRPTYYELYDGSRPGSDLFGLSGRALDYAIVHREQSAAQGFIDNLGSNDKSTLFSEANAMVNLSPNPAIRSAVHNLGHPFNYGNQADREAVGRSETDQARQQHCSIPTGSHICQ